MPDPKDFNMEFRPLSYWSDHEHPKVSTKIKGELRRQEAIRLENEGVYDPVICGESLTEENLIAAGRFHPMFMGGEYLPDYLPHEVEIVRVTLKSTAMDVISLRARRLKHRIAYRIVDEYGDEGFFDYHLIQKTSARPLTMKRLIELIDNAQEHGGLSGNARHFNYEMAPEYIYEYQDFATITSDFYPELSDWYDQANEEWLDAQLFEQTGQTKEERMEEEFRDRFLNRKPARSEQEKEWRRRNGKTLQAERRELESIRLDVEYEKRYRAQCSPKGEDEIKWRMQNAAGLNKQIGFESAVTSCMARAEWAMGAGMGGAHGAAMRRGNIRSFIENYIRSNGKAPFGEHTVKITGGANAFNIKVNFR